MSERYQTAFSRHHSRGKKAFIPFTMLGWPDATTCRQTIQLMIDQGATALELGIAFSDPVADGPIIQEAAFETLSSGFTTSDALSLVAAVRADNADIPIGLLTYANIVHASDVGNFLSRAKSAGADSLLIADVTPDAAGDTLAAAKAAGVSLVFLASPLTDEARLRRIADASDAYIYLVSRLGITGSEEKHDDQLKDLLSRARRITNLPLCVGFGVSSPESARAMIAAGADGVITGSKIIELVRLGDQNRLPLFLKQMADVCNSSVMIS